MEPKHKDCIETSMHKNMKNHKQYNEREEEEE
jgi:hypothetical protein